jgi:hypothetical protein
VITQQIHDALARAAEVRMPRFTPDMGPRQKVELLEDYLNLTAVTRAELEEARLWAHMGLRELTEQWDAIQGWGMHLSSGNGRHTKDDIVAAKREIRPDLHDGLREARWLVDRISEQIERLGARMGDDQVASRIYTLIAG